MMSLDSHITLAVIFSFISMIGTLGSIYAIIHSKQNEDTTREVSDAKEFLKINMKLDEFCRQLSTLAKNSDKTSDTLAVLQQHIVKIDGRLSEFDRRITDIEEKIKDM